MRKINNLMLKYQNQHEAFLKYFSWEASWYWRPDEKIIDYTDQDLGRNPDGYVKKAMGERGMGFSIIIRPLSFQFPSQNAWHKGADWLKDLFLQKGGLLEKLWWLSASEDERNYILARASHIAIYGTEEGVFYPRPADPQANRVVDEIVRLQEQYDWTTAVEEFRRFKRIDHDGFETRDLPRMIQEEVAVTNPPETLTGRILSPRERDELYKVCDDIVRKSDHAVKARTVIEEFVQFCRLLAEPENHIKRESHVYVEKPALTKSTREMQAEKEQELMRLPEGVAYFNGKQNGAEIVVKLRTDIVDNRFPKLREADAMERIVLRNGQEYGYLRERKSVEEEIAKKRARRETEAKRSTSLPSPPGGEGPESPPPSGWS